MGSSFFFRGCSKFLFKWFMLLLEVVEIPDDDDDENFDGTTLQLGSPWTQAH